MKYEEAFRINFDDKNPLEDMRLLPARMYPLPDELLSSWLVRLAMAHGLKLHSFCVNIFGKGTSIWNRDTDKLADERVLGIIANKTGVPFNQAFQTTLADYAGKIYETHNPLGNTVWIMPLRIYHRQRRRNGLQFCPFCLREDAEPYYRREWRLSWITVCEKHEIVLLDKCPECSNPVVFHRQEMGNRNQPFCYSMTECSFCETVWTGGKTLSICKKATLKSVRFQKSLKEIINTNWGTVPGFGFVHSILFFKGLKQLLRILSICNRSVAFRDEIRRRSKFEIEEKTKVMSFDYLPVEKRCFVLLAAAWLIKSWATKFIEIAQKTRTWSSVLLPQDNDTPFWYWSIVRENLTRESQGISEQEIISAISLLERRSLVKKKFILPSHLYKLIQNNDALHKKSLDFKVRIYERMKSFNDLLSKKMNHKFSNIYLSSTLDYEYSQSIIENSIQKIRSSEKFQ